MGQAADFATLRDTKRREDLRRRLLKVYGSDERGLAALVHDRLYLRVKTLLGMGHPIVAPIIRTLTAEIMSDLVQREVTVSELDGLWKDIDRRSALPGAADKLAEQSRRAA